MKYKKEASAGGIIFKKEGDQIFWLIIQHSQHKGWVFPKGLVGDNVKNEPREKAALREVKEEGGIEAKILVDEPIEIHYKYRFKEFLIYKTVYYFLMEYLSGDPKDHDREASEAKFMETEEIKKILTYKSDQEAFDKALAAFGKLQ